MNFVSILMDSESDYEIMKNCIDTFEKFNVKYEIVISSATSSQDRTTQCVKDAEKKGAVVFIASTNTAANLASTLVTKPVIEANMDSSLSTVQTSVVSPVGTVACAQIGTANAAYFAMQILAITNKELAVKLKEDRIVQSKKIENNSSSIK